MKPNRALAVALRRWAMALPLLALNVPGAKADVRLNIHSDSIVVEASNATTADVLAALSASGALQFRTSVELSRAVSGTYSGTLRQVVSRILQGYNFVLTGSEKRIDAAISGYAGEPAVAARISAPPAQPSPPADVAVQLRSAVDVQLMDRRPSASSVPLTAASSVPLTASGSNVQSSPPPPVATTAGMAVMTQQARAQINALAASLQALNP